MQKLPALPERRLLVLALLIFAGVATLAAALLLPGRMAGAADAPRRIPNAAGIDLSPTQWATLKIEAVRTAAFDVELVTDGWVSADDNKTVPVFAPYSGRVVSVKVQQGESVHAGQTLATVQGFESSQAASDLAAATAAEAAARRQAELARRTEQRQHALLEADAGAEKDWLQSQADAASAQDNWHAAHVALEAARAKASLMGADHAQAGTVNITAPLDGVVVQRQVAPGQLITSPMTGGVAPLFTVTDLQQVSVIAAVSETDAAQLRVGQPVEVRGVSRRGVPLRARVAAIGAVLDPATRRVAVRIATDNASALLKPQMMVAVSFLSDTPKPTVAIPRRAIVFDGSLARCYVVSGAKQLSARELQLGRAQGELVEVKAGLRPGEQVVTDGALFIDRAAEDAAS
jgi:cobalt-zinc-cadmium efflux system membrane fusion protein